MAYKPAAPSYFDSDPSVALAKAQEIRGITSLNAWLKAQQQLAGLTNRVGTERLNRGFGNDRSYLLNSLAARGFGRSGDVGFQQGQLALDYADKRYDQSAGILSRLSEVMGSYLKQKGGLRDNTVDAYTGAFQQAGENPVSGFTPPPAPVTPTVKTVAPYKPRRPRGLSPQARGW